MFYPQEMAQIRLIIPSRDLLAVTKDLADQGVFHQSDGKYPTPENPPESVNYWKDRAATYAAMERRIMGIMQGLDIQPGSPPEVDYSSLVDINQVSPVVEQIDPEVRQIRELIIDSQKRLEQLQNILSQIEPITGIDLDLNMLRNPGYIYTILGVVPAANIDRLRISLGKIPHVFNVLRQDNQRAIVWLAGMKRDSEVLDRAVRSAYLNPLSLPETYQGTPAEITTSIRADIKQVQGQMSDQREELKRLAKDRNQQLRTLLWQVNASRVLAEAIGRFGRFRYTYIITGWVPTSEVPDFSRHLKKISNDILIETSPYKRGGKELDVPVALNNPKLIRPFQEFVTNYARPRYEEMDPTFLLAITFPFLFGAMFGDIGQGLVLTTLGLLLASRRIKSMSSLAGIGGVVAACGISSTIFGFLYGSIFGFEDILHALILRPMDNILTTLAIAIGIGVVILSIGYLINIVNAWTNHDLGNLLFEPHSIAGLVLYWSLIGLALEVLLGKLIIPPAVIGIIALLTALAIMFSELLKHLVENHRPLVEGGVVIYAFRSFFELFEVLISLLSNTISYVRVGAFAVAHVGLTSVFFILAGLVSPTHGIGYWMMVIIGNIFIIGFEGLIVGIQTMRLSYYELFSKFFVGGGVRYDPLTLRPKKLGE